MSKTNPTNTSGAAKWYDYKKDAGIKHQWWQMHICTLNIQNPSDKIKMYMYNG